MNRFDKEHREERMNNTEKHSTLADCMSSIETCLGDFGTWKARVERQLLNQETRLEWLEQQPPQSVTDE